MTKQNNPYIGSEWYAPVSRQTHCADPYQLTGASIPGYLRGGIMPNYQGGLGTGMPAPMVCVETYTDLDRQRCIIDIRYDNKKFSMYHGEPEKAEEVALPVHIQSWRDLYRFVQDMKKKGWQISKQAEDGIVANFTMDAMDRGHETG